MVRLIPITFLWMYGLVNILQAQSTRTVWLNELAIKSFSEGILAMLGKTNAAGNFMHINGTYFSHGVGVTATSNIKLYKNWNKGHLSSSECVETKRPW
ncbi:NPCBM/NEW2 domain-containing protein [Spirosoma sp. SC4-14]|uniref:NPCBM/NEW2 domain-containing protein n=1 Tax=Spirosoma sp. SC4-14 TaxID=3128900 RepID=UPI0030CE1C2A